MVNPLPVPPGMAELTSAMADRSTVTGDHLMDIVVDTPMFVVTFARRDPAVLTATEFFANSVVDGAVIQGVKRAEQKSLALFAISVGIRAVARYPKYFMRLNSFATTMVYRKNAGTVTDGYPGFVLNGMIKLDGRPADVIIKPKQRDENGTIR